MKTPKEVKEFFGKRAINTNEVMEKHTIRVVNSLGEDDDESWYRAIIPFWSQRRSVVHGVVRLLNEVIEWCPDAHILAYEGRIEVHIATHARDSV